MEGDQSLSTIETFNQIASHLAEARRKHERGEIEEARRLCGDAGSDFETYREELERLPGVGVLKDARATTRTVVGE
jgi:endonuclease III